jgi:hypothetical protein
MTSAIQDLMAELLVFVAAATGTAGAPAPPEVVPIARPALEQRVCGKPCPVVALFDPRLGILVDDRLDLAGGAAAQSVLLHELVHFVQWRTSGRTAATCAEWLAREREAYRIQFAWLASLPDEVRGAAPARPNLSRLRCEGPPVQAVTQPHPAPVGLDARAGFSYKERN